MSASNEENTVRQQAVYWLVRLNAGDLTDQETLEFANWLSADYTHSHALADAEQLFQDMTIVAKINAISSDDNNMRASSVAMYPLKPKGHKRNRIQSLYQQPLFAVAATILLVALFNVSFTSRWLDDLRSDYYTGVGEQQEIVLKDGSRVLMDTDTALRFINGQERREVVLLRGQARFDVAPDAQRPFEVTSVDLTVRALGTVFNVQRLANDGVQVAVQEHAVMVKDNINAESQMVAKGQMLVFRVGQSLSRPQVANLDQVTSWQNHYLTINDRPLSELITELERYRSERIILAGDGLASMRVTGVFSLNDPDKVLATVCGVLNLKQINVGSWLIVLHG